jgi:thiol:disulfide interchange protein DsbD
MKNYYFQDEYNQIKFKVPLLFLLVRLAIFLLISPVHAQKQASGKAMLIPMVNGYQLGEQGPLFILLKNIFPSDFKVNEEEIKVQLLFTEYPEIKADFLMFQDVESQMIPQGVWVAGFKLSLPSDFARGKTVKKATLLLHDRDKQVASVDLSLPLTILPAGQSPRLLSPEMAASLGMRPGALANKAMAKVDNPKNNTDDWQDKSIWLILLLVFGGGLALNLTPCVYPLIPITISFFGGRSHGSKGLMAVNSLVYLGGLCLTYTVIGALIALTGQMLGQALTWPPVVMLVALIMVVMALSMFGLWEIKLPSGLNRLASANRGGILGTFVMGLTVGLLAAPCVGPFVVSLMTHVATVGRLDYGLLVFFIFSLGLGLPLTVLAFFSGSIARLPGAGEWMVWVRRFFGVVLLLMALYVLKPVLGQASFDWGLLVVGLLGAIYLGFIEKSGTGRFMTFKRIFALGAICAVLVFGYFNLSPALFSRPASSHVAWQAFSPEMLGKAARENKPVVVDFAADWCMPCKQMDANVFSDQEVIEALGDFVALRADVTNGASPELKPYAAKWRLRGVPTLIFLDKQGNWLKELTIVGAVPKEVVLDRLNQVMSLSGG